MPAKPVNRANRHNKSKTSSNLPFVIGGALLALIVLAIALQPPAKDPKTVCSQKSIPGHTVLLLDVSDKLTPAQHERLKNELMNLSATSTNRPDALLSKGEKLTLYFTNEDGEMPTKAFSMCHPGRLEDRNTSESLSEGAIYAQKKWEAFSTTTLAAIDNKLMSTTSLSSSPILESINYIRSKEFPPPSVISSDDNSRLLIWSDLLENSSEKNHFSSDLKNDASYAEYPISLNNVDVSIYYLLSEKYSNHQTKYHKQWWRKFFANAGADLQSWMTIK